MVSKDQVRRHALEIRNGLNENFRARQSAVIMEQVWQSELYERAEIVLSYSAIHSEVDTGLLNREVVRQGKKLYLPKTYAAEKRMCFFPVEDFRQLRSGYQGILEPEETTPVENIFAEADTYTKEDVLMIMPGVAFDERGYRLGYGGGYYDRYLAQYGGKLTSLLVAFDEQKTERIPADPYDVKPACIITQSTIRA